MKPRITVITLGVENLERSLAFYRDGLGLPTEGIVGKEFEYGAVAFFDLQSGVKLALWPRENIARDAGVPRAPRSATELTLGHNLNSKKEVDAVMAQAKKAGARIVKEPADRFWGGYAGYFQDPDDHLWEDSLESPVGRPGIVHRDDGRPRAGRHELVEGPEAPNAPRG